MGKVAWKREPPEAPAARRSLRRRRSEGRPTPPRARTRCRTAEPSPWIEAEDERVPHGTGEDTAEAPGGIRQSWSSGVLWRWVKVGRWLEAALRERVQRVADQSEGAAAEAVTQI